MTDFQEKAIRAIEAQQGSLEDCRAGRSAKPNDGPGRKKLSGSLAAAWMVGEQLKDICRMEPRSAELIAQDLEVKGMGIVDAEKKIKAFADGHKTGNFACVPPAEADRILREFYGLAEPGEAPGQAAGGDVIALLDFL